MENVITSMKIKNILILASSLAVVGLAPSAFGFAEVARGKLTATAKLAYTHDTNIFANNNEVTDSSLIFTPSLSFARNVGRVTTSAQVSVSSINFQDNTAQDSIDPSVSLNFNVDRAEKGSVSQSLSYIRSSNANEALNDRAESNEFRGATKIDYYYSEKTGIRINAGYRLSDFISTGYNSVRSYTIGGGLIYKYSPKLTASATYSYRPEEATELGTGAVSDPSSKNHRFQVGLEGQLQPKLTGNISVGVVYRDFDLGGDTNTFLVQSVLSWAVDEKNSVSLTASNDFDTTPGAESAENRSIGVTTRHSLSSKLSVGFSFANQNSKLQQRATAINNSPTKRTDKANTFGVNGSYRANDQLNIQASLSWRDNDSDLARATYKRNTATVSATYSF